MGTSSCRMAGYHSRHQVDAGSHSLSLHRSDTAIPRSHFTSLGAPHRLTLSTLSSIPSDPLASITPECWRQFPPNQTLQILGSSDSRFSQMAENATVEGGLALTLTGWRESRVQEALLFRFCEAGNINTDFLESGARRELRGTSFKCSDTYFVDKL